MLRLSCFIVIWTVLAGQDAVALGPLRIVSACGKILHHQVTDPSDLGLAADLTGFENPQQAIQFVKDYYREIDDRNIQNILLRFDKSARYLRSGEWIDGIVGLTDFYEKIRQLDGVHIVESMNVEGNAVVVSIGRFEGRVKGEYGVLQFADIWWFRPGTKLAIFRESMIWHNGQAVEVHSTPLLNERPA